MNAEPPQSPWTEVVRADASRLAAALAEAGRPLLHCPSLPGAAEAFLAWALRESLQVPVILVSDGPRSMDRAFADLRTLAPSPSAQPLCYPPIESTPSAGTVRGRPSQETGERLAVLAALPETKAPLIATCIQALLQPAVSPAALGRRLLRLRPGQPLSLEQLTAYLEREGYHFGAEVQAAGEAAVRGGIVDAWPPSLPMPVRIELFGPTVESLRSFDPETQQSRLQIQAAALTPATEAAVLDESPRTMLLDAIAAGAVVIWAGIDNIRHHARILEESPGPTAEARPAFTLDAVLAGCASARLQIFTGALDTPTSPAPPLDFAPLDGVPAPGNGLFLPDAAEAARSRFLSGLVARARHGFKVMVYVDTPGALARFRETAPGGVLDVLDTAVGSLSEGFESRELRLVVVAESDLYGRRRTGRDRTRGHPAKAAVAADQAGPRILDHGSIEPGDLVVHVDHGIGRYLGLHEILIGGQKQEALTIEYAEGARLHVPVSHAHLLTRYIGVGKHLARLHALGGRRWQGEKEAAERAVADLAASLLETQAARSVQHGLASSADKPWQHEFEAAFPYVETPDQARAIQDVKADMQSARPMDRLICGDAGYGKTEVAVRAAFKAVMDSRQVAVLVPTTVLAQQHYYTFCERMAAYPVRIEMLSRFCPREERHAIARGLRDGSVDIVIGTHGLLDPTLAFANLGLVVIDEEQRFGVEHKERFKQMRRLVDVLTLTATPIPRTLYMSLMGVRDLSTIQTPPQERVPIETIVAENTDAVVREAIIRELNREGQVYYLHNRVRTIEAVRERLTRLVPEARFAVAHGQMGAAALAAVMQLFVRAETDVLICTTIVESGTDIPNANTILIDRADRFGVADLYQLRGRAGRSRQRGYAYMLLPPRGTLDPTARSRIEAVRRHSGLGAGFRLAMRDLEIRGAGNLLGHQQSGHIAAVGFSLYCQLLRLSVDRLKGRRVQPAIETEVRLDFVDFSPDAAPLPNSAVIPAAYIEDEPLRLSQYRRLAGAGSPAEIAAIRRDLRDRFGPPPPAVERLLLLARLRILAALRGIRSVEVREDRLMLRQETGDFIADAGRFPRLAREDCADRLREIARHLERLPARGPEAGPPAPAP